MADGSKYKDKLTSEQYDMLFNSVSEYPFMGEYDDFYENGVYACAACGTVLFESGAKFDAHCGWPSFYDAKPDAVNFHEDRTEGMIRTEVTCATCGGHLGHVFEGEGFNVPTDQRYCIGSPALKFIPAKKV